MSKHSPRRLAKEPDSEHRRGIANKTDEFAPNRKHHYFLLGLLGRELFKRASTA